jgi:hypothetical protein
MYRKLAASFPRFFKGARCFDVRILWIWNAGTTGGIFARRCKYLKVERYYVTVS